jgi:hypothetical protein
MLQWRGRTGAGAGCADAQAGLPYMRPVFVGFLFAMCVAAFEEGICHLFCSGIADLFRLWSTLVILKPVDAGLAVLVVPPP